MAVILHSCTHHAPRTIRRASGWAFAGLLVFSSYFGYVPSIARAFPIAVPTPPQDVTLTAGTGTYDGTAGWVWVRLYSSHSQTWSGWKAIDGLSRGESKQIRFDEGPTFSRVTGIQVWNGGDGVRLHIFVEQNDGGIYAVSPATRWIKNQSFEYSVYSLTSATCGYVGPVYECSCSGYEDCNNLIAKCAEDGQDLNCTDNSMGGCVKGSCQPNPPPSNG